MKNPKLPLTFKSVGQTGLWTANDGEGRSRMTVIRSSANSDPTMHRITAANILIMGGSRTLDQLRQLMSEMGYPTLSGMWPGGMSASTYTKLRQYLNITERSEHGIHHPTTL